MSTIHAIRRARANLVDATLLQDVEHDSLGDSDYSPKEMLAVLRRPEQIVYLACDGGGTGGMPSIIGFCACMVTSLDPSQRCLEVDMLGVRPAYRSRGVATQLIERAVHDAHAQRIEKMRAVVADDNLASQKAFERVGFRRTEPIRCMLVHELAGSHEATWLPKGWQWQVQEGIATSMQDQNDAAYALQAETHTIVSEDGRKVAQGICLAVSTMAYNGLWLESLQGATSRGREILARALVLRARRLGLDEVGCLASTNDADLQQALANQGYQEVGRYWLYGAGQRS